MESLGVWPAITWGAHLSDVILTYVGLGQRKAGGSVIDMASSHWENKLLSFTHTHTMNQHPLTHPHTPCRLNISALLAPTAAAEKEPAAAAFILGSRYCRNCPLVC